MAYRKFEDGNKAPIMLFEWDGHIFSGSLTLQNWHQVTDMSSRESDVLLCGYPKSGLHWLWEIVTMLKTSCAQLTTHRMETHGFLMMSSSAQLDSLPSPRVLATHRRFHDLPSDFVTKRRKMVLILREPKDTCVSYYHMLRKVKGMDYDGSFQGFVPLFLSGHVPMGSWSGWVLSFEKGLREHPQLSVHVMRYERLKADPVGEIKRLARYLGCSEALAGDVAKKTQFSAMKSFKDAVDNPFAKYFENNTDGIFRKGQPEEWKQYFTPEQAQHFTAQLQRNLGRPTVKANL